MNTVEIKTPSGYTVTLKPFLTYAQYLEVQAIISAKMSIDAAGQIQGMSGASLIDANRKTLEFLLVKVVMPDGTESNNPIGAVDEMPVDDGLAVAEKINELTASKKKAS